MTHVFDYFIRATLINWTDPYGELGSTESGFLCFVDKSQVLQCYKMLTEKTLAEIRGHDLLVTIGRVTSEEDEQCDIIFCNRKTFKDFEGDFTVIDEGVDFGNFDECVEQLCFVDGNFIRKTY